MPALQVINFQKEKGKTGILGKIQEVLGSLLYVQLMMSATLPEAMKKVEMKVEKLQIGETVLFQESLELQRRGNPLAKFQ